MINELYLKRAVNIRKDYIEIRTNIDKYEVIAQSLANSLELRLKDLESLQEAINNKRVTSIEAAKENVQKVMIDAEADMNKVEASINDLLKRMENLAEEEKTLYRDIRQTYPEKTDEQLREEINEYLKKENLP